jgi:membrane protein DedA with SNARE-associated domain
MARARCSARGVPLAPFDALTAIGCALWAVAFVLVGLLAGAAWGEIDSVLGKVLLAVGLVVIALTLLHGRGRHDSHES